MKVLHVIPSVALTEGGTSRAIVEIERALAARGVRVTVVTTIEGSAQESSVPRGAPIVTPYGERWYFPRTTSFYKTSIGLRRWLKGNIENFDVVHAHALFSFAPVAAASLARARGIPYVLQPHGTLGRYGVSSRRPYLKKVSLTLIERRLIESASAVLFTSLAEQHEAAELELKYRGVVIPLGIDIGELANLAPRNPFEGNVPFNLLFLSRIDPKKNLEGLLQALVSVIANHPTMRLNIAGEGDHAYLMRLKSLARELGVAGNIRWLGHVTGDEKRQAFAEAAAFVLPSYSENFGIAVVEALAAGLPCIVSDGVALSSEIKAARAGIVTGMDPESIAAGIEQVFCDQVNYYAISRASRGLASNTFSLETMGKRLEALYADVLRSDQSRRRLRA